MFYLGACIRSELNEGLDVTCVTHANLATGSSDFFLGRRQMQLSHEFTIHRPEQREKMADSLTVIHCGHLLQRVAVLSQ